MANPIVPISAPAMGLVSVLTLSIAPLRPASVPLAAAVGVGNTLVRRFQTINLIGTHPYVSLTPTSVWLAVLMTIVFVVSIVTKQGSARGTIEKGVIFVSLVSTQTNVGFSRRVSAQIDTGTPGGCITACAEDGACPGDSVCRGRPIGADLIFVCHPRAGPMGVIVITVGVAKLLAVTMSLVLRVSSVMRASVKISLRTMMNHKMVTASKHNLNVVVAQRTQPWRRCSFVGPCDLEAPFSRRRRI